MAVAVSMAKHLGAQPAGRSHRWKRGRSARGLRGRAGLEAHIFMPRDTPRANIIECREAGRDMSILIDGFDHGLRREVARRKAAEGWFEMSTLKEPYRIEGKKTLGYELADSSTGAAGRRSCIHWWRDSVLSAACGRPSTRWRPSAGLVLRDRTCSRCKRRLRPLLPHSKRRGDAAEFPDARTCRPPVRVPKAVGDFLMLKILHESKAAP